MALALKTHEGWYAIKQGNKNKQKCLRKWIKIAIILL